MEDLYQYDQAACKERDQLLAWIARDDRRKEALLQVPASSGALCLGQNGRVARKDSAQPAVAL